MARCYVCRWIMWPWTRAHTAVIEEHRVFAHEGCVDPSLAPEPSTRTRGAE